MSQASSSSAAAAALGSGADLARTRELRSLLQRTDLDEEDRLRLAQEYTEQMERAFSLATAQTQDDLVEVLPPVTQVRDLLLWPLASQILLRWSNLITRLVFSESGASLTEDTTVVTAHGQRLVAYLLSMSPSSLVMSVLYPVTEEMFGRESLPLSQELVQTMDRLYVWILRVAVDVYGGGAPAGSAYPGSGPTLVTERMADAFGEIEEALETQTEAVPDTFPNGHSAITDVLPLTYTLLWPYVQARAQQLRQATLQAAANALGGRLRARRRLTAPLYLLPDPTYTAAEGELTIVTESTPRPSRGGRQRRRASRAGVVVTPQSSTAEIQQFLQWQAQQEEEFVARSGGARPNVLRPSRGRVTVSLAAAGPAPSLSSTTSTSSSSSSSLSSSSSSSSSSAATSFSSGAESLSSASSAVSSAPAAPLSNCQRFANRCDAPTNLSGTGWCRVPEVFWWGPLQPGNTCWDIRELLTFNADRVVEVPGVRRARPPAYPDRRPLSDDYLRTFVEIAKRNNYPVPEEIEIYLLGLRIQQRPRPALFPEGSTPRLRLIERSPYAAVRRFQDLHDTHVQQQFMDAMRGNVGPQPEASEDDE